MTPVLVTLLVAACGFLVYLLLRISAEARKRLQDASRTAIQIAALGENYHQKLRALSDSSGAGIVMLDERGIVVHSNATAESMLGCESDSMIGHALIQATLSSEMQEFVVKAAGASRPQARDFPFTGAPSRILRASVYPFAQGLSGTAETMLVLVDVTELRRLETIRRDFVANVSHEMRTPLASIRAMAETLADGALHDEDVAHRFLETIIREADRLTRISQDLLILSDAESKAPSKETFDLDALLRDVVGRSKAHAAERNVELNLETSGPLSVHASRDQIEQVVVNLVDNAIKYTGAGGRVDVRADSLEREMKIEVTDTGIGIMEEHLPRIFERFYRVDKARSRESGGTGLGLSIVKNIIEAHGGEVSVQSRFNHGSTFSVTLPKQEDPT